jgi:hypothetical protein
MGVTVVPARGIESPCVRESTAAYTGAVLLARFLARLLLWAIPKVVVGTAVGGGIAAALSGGHWSYIVLFVIATCGVAFLLWLRSAADRARASGHVPPHPPMDEQGALEAPSGPPQGPVLNPGPSSTPVSSKRAPRGRPPLWVRRPVALLVIAATVWVILLPLSPNLDHAIRAVAAGSWDRVFPDPIDEAPMVMRELTATAGSSAFVSMTFGDSEARAAIPTASGIAGFRWQNYRSEGLGPSAGWPASAEDALVSEADVDVSRLRALVDRSLADADLEGIGDCGLWSALTQDGGYEGPLAGCGSPQVTVAREGDTGEVALRVSFANLYKNAEYVYAVDGRLIRRSGTAFL